MICSTHLPTCVQVLPGQCTEDMYRRTIKLVLRRLEDSGEAGHFSTASKRATVWREVYDPVAAMLARPEGPGVPSDSDVLAIVEALVLVAPSMVQRTVISADADSVPDALEDLDSVLARQRAWVALRNNLRAAGRKVEKAVVDLAQAKTARDSMYEAVLQRLRQEIPVHLAPMQREPSTELVGITRRVARCVTEASLQVTDARMIAQVLAAVDNNLLVPVADKDDSAHAMFHACLAQLRVLATRLAL